MIVKNSRRLWIFVGLMVVLANVACSLLSQTLSSEPAQISPTRTPLPTFTATSEAQTLIIPPTETPLPPPEVPAVEPAPTDTPIPEQNAPIVEQTSEPQESLAANSTDGQGGSEVAEEDTPPSEEPAPTPVPPPPPAEPAPAEPAAPAEPGAGVHGVIGKITFREGRNTYGVGEKVFVKIEATHTQPGQLPFGILGLNTSTGTFQTSWSSGTIDGTFTHEDGLPFNAPGNHKMWLSICFSPEDICKGPDGDWERFEPGLDVVIQ